MSKHASTQPATVVIVGAGIAGLRAAYRLHRLASKQGGELQPRLLEADSRAGGDTDAVR